MRNGKPALRIPAAAAALLLLVGCASSPAPEGGFRNAFCAQHWSHLQQALAAEGLRDAQAQPVPGAPYLRVTRTLAAFDLPALERTQRLEWLRLAHEEGFQGLEAEVSRLESDPGPTLDRLRECARGEIGLIAFDDDRWQRLAEKVPTPDAYRHWRRYAGLLPLVRPLLRAQVHRLEARLESRYGQYEPRGEWQRYAPSLTLSSEKGETPSTWAIVSYARERSSLGLYHFTPRERQFLLERHAPVLAVETLGHHDRPGSPEWRNKRWEITPPARAYTHVTVTRWQGEWVPQLVYHFWFDERPKEHPLDLFGGRLDGLIWRVTLDADGEILLYDSVHPCGCYLAWHPVEERLALNPQAPDEGIMTLMPVSLPEDGTQRPEIRLQSGTHYLVDILYKPEHDDTPSRSYELTPYSQLRSLQDNGTTRSLFGPRGLVPGTQRLERFLLWNTGVLSPGAMRQWGHHATSFIGIRHFDSPDLLDRYFLPQEP